MTELHLCTSLIEIGSFRLESMIGKKSNSKAISLPLVPTEPDFSEYDSSKTERDAEKKYGVFLQRI